MIQSMGTRNQIAAWFRNDNWFTAALITLCLAVGAPFAMADDGELGLENGGSSDRSAELMSLDAMLADVVSNGPGAKVEKNLATRGVGSRLVPGATTDVWAHNGYAYTGTFSNPCGGDPDAGVWTWHVKNASKVDFVGVIPSPVGSRANDVKAAAMNSGDVLVHSNESCGGGPGGFELYNVDDPANPIHLASVQTDDINLLLRDGLGFTDFGVHNLFLFTQGELDYVAATVESEFGNFQIFDITDPTNPTLVGFWGAEQLFLPGITDWENLSDFGVILDVDAYLFSGFGRSQNRFLHDITISADGSQAYLANWDAGLVLLDISDPTDPQVISVAIDPTSGDGEVNSHAVWPSEDGTVVMEGEEDFSPTSIEFTIDSGPNVGSYPSQEGAFTLSIETLPGQEMTGPTIYVGLACAPITAGDGIALVQRGACNFDLKATNAIDAGYSGMVVFNDAARGDALVSMGGASRPIPGVFVGHSTGLAVAGAANDASLVVGAAGADATAKLVADEWGGFRVWDYSDPANPVLAATFHTVCSATVIDPICDPAGTYTAHNVIVESTEDRIKAYIAWYSDGVLVLDITDPYNPVETARYQADGENYWGIYKTPEEPWIYASDRNGGLRILKEYGSGSKK